MDDLCYNNLTCKLQYEWEGVGEMAAFGMPLLCYDTASENLWIEI